MKPLFSKIHHIAVICSDYQRSKAFYVNLLGFSVVKEDYRPKRKSYKLDLEMDNNIRLELFSFPSPPNRLSYPEAAGLRHLAFEVDDVDFVRSYLIAHHVEVEPVRTDEATGKQFTFFYDPDDLPIEIYEG